MLDRGLNVISGKKVALAAPPEVIYTDPLTKTQSLYYRVLVSRSMSLEELKEEHKDGCAW